MDLPHPANPPTHGCVHQEAQAGRTIVHESPFNINYKFLVADNAPLDSARELWEAVSTDGGFGFLDNLTILRGKDEAMWSPASRMVDTR
ncbi:hypothetical protein E2562_005176 [Oryza meyeriana var. granulata]|uniref:Uncharacterized protein n=1 Tax=Oryza meyeriana var. granulata TaxID=110450 RepID=A0A6G1BRW0_9ORYZ|nr:hypothetical protein E2562_005176 [Oryza meyeriana var. granulata]